MSVSLSLLPARRRPGALGGLQTRMEQIAQRVDAPWKWSSSGGKAFCLPWRRKAPFPSQTQPARLAARGKAECLPSLRPSQCQGASPCSLPVGDPAPSAGCKLTWNKSRNALMRRGNGLLLEGRHSAFPGAARRLSFANAASAPDGAREGRMPSLLKALPMSGSLSLLPARRRPGALGGLQTRMEQIAQRVDAPWKWSSVEGRHSAFPGAARRLSFANAASAPDGAREGRMPSLLKALPMSGSLSLSPARRRPDVLGALQTRMEQIAQRVDAPWKWSSVEGRHSAFPGAARRLSFANAASAPDGAREGRMPSLLKALPMSGSLSLLSARRRPGALGGLQTRTEQIAQPVDAPWKWSSVEGRHSAFPGAARRLSFANAASAPDGAREARMPSLLKALPRSGACPCSLRVADPASSAGCKLTWNKSRNALMLRGNGLLLEGRHSAFPGAARRLSFADAASAPDGAREGRMPSLQGPGTSKLGAAVGLGGDSSEAAPSRTWRWAFRGGKAFCLPWRRKAPFLRRRSQRA